MKFKVILLFLLSQFLIIDSIKASIKIIISPPIYESEIRPGEQNTFDISLRNISSSPVSLIGYVHSFQMDKNGRPLFIDNPKIPYSCQSWISIDPSEIQIEGGQEKIVQASIRAPSDVSGGNYSAILFEILQQDSKKLANNVKLALRTSTLVLLTVRNTVKLDAEIISFDISQQSKRSIFKVFLKNNSNRHIKPTASIVIFEDQKRVIDRINFNNNNFIMPDSERLLTCVWENPRKRNRNENYIAECRFEIKGLGKSLIERKKFSTSQ